LEAADSAILLNSPAQFSRAAKAWRRCSFLGLDTEFVRERTYFANIGLVQVSDGHTAWLVDPLAEGALGPLKSLMEDSSVVKVVHSPSEDLEVLQHAIGAVPDPIIDTQVACALLGQPLQVGYHTAAQWLLDVEVDKGQTRSNWCARPLRKEQLRYAALDVCLLPLMWDLLRDRLEEKGRLQWLLEDCESQIQKARQVADTSMSWQRIRGHGRLDGQQLAILQSLAKWRESEARRRNRPRGFVITDPLLLNMARKKMTTIDDLETLDDLHPRAISRHGEAIIQRIRKVIDSGNKLEVIKPMTTSERKRFSKMRQRVQGVAAEHGIEAVVLASKRDLETLIRNGGDSWPEKLIGWRQTLLHQELEQWLGTDP
jgi:ribonuclease D